MPATFSKDSLVKAARVLAMAITVAAVGLHVVSLTHAGGLWRDETGMANIARLPSAGEILQGLMHDHCPMVFPEALKAWTALGLAPDDFGLRVFGFCVGLFLLASFWAAGRMMGRGLPLLALSLVALNPVVIRYGDAMRGYGLGTAIIILTMGLIWRFIEKPGLGRGLIAVVAAVLSVQSLYQNAFFLLAICTGGMVVCLRQRRVTTVLGLLGIGFVAALSLLPYVNPIRQSQNWYVVNRLPVSEAGAFHNLHQLIGPLFVVWLVVVILAAIFGLGWIFTRAQPDATAPQPDLPLFAGIALVLGAIGFGTFIKLSGLPTQVWYYIPLLCFTVVCCDLIFPRVRPAMLSCVLIVVLIALALSPAGYYTLRIRQTNGDLLAVQVATLATADDLIIVHPWYNGLTFARYYHGPAKWTTLPPIADYRYHRYDLIKEQLATPNAIAPVLDQVAATLRAGHRVWIAGSIPTWSPDSPVPDDPPVAPNLPTRWLDAPYSWAWGNELGCFIVQHSTNYALVMNPSTNAIPINPLEKMALAVSTGWRTNSAGPAQK